MALTSLSETRLATCHPDLQRLVRAVAQVTPLAVLVGFRNQAEQDAAFHDGFSRLRWPISAHNNTPATAVDLAPLPVDWGDVDSFRRLAGDVKEAALELGIRISWGGDWASFKDYDHFQLA